MVDFYSDFQGIDRLYHIEDGDGFFSLVLLEMPDKVPLDFAADYPVDPFRFLNIVFPDDFNAGRNGFQDFPGLSRLSGGYQYDAIGQLSKYLPDVLLNCRGYLAVYPAPPVVVSAVSLAAAAPECNRCIALSNH